MGKMVRIQLVPGDRKRLRALDSDGKASQNHAQRAQIFALAADGFDTDEILRCLGVSKPTNRRWRALRWGRRRRVVPRQNAPPGKPR